MSFDDRDYKDPRGQIHLSGQEGLVIQPGGLPAFPRALDQLEKELHTLREELGMLYDRLGPVQRDPRPEPEESQGENKRAEEPHSEAVRRIEGFISIVHLMLSRNLDERTRPEI